MEALRDGLAGDTIVSFYPTSQFMSNVSYLELAMAQSLLQEFRSAVKFTLKSKYMQYGIELLLALLETRQAFSRDSPGTVSENFLGLARTRDGKRGDPWVMRLVTLFESVVIPLSSFLEDIQPEMFQYKKVVQTQRFYKLTKSVIGILFIAGLSSYATPLQLLARIRIVRDNKSSGSTDKLSKYAKISAILGASVWTFVYLVQFAQWYYSHEETLQPGRAVSMSGGSSGPIVIPPTTTPIGLPADPSLCPICKNLRSNPTALVATGHVFCYQCIWNWLEKSGPVCPVTQKIIPANKDLSKFVRRLV